MGRKYRDVKRDKQYLAFSVSVFLFYLLLSRHETFRMNVRGFVVSTIRSPVRQQHLFTEMPPPRDPSIVNIYEHRSGESVAFSPFKNYADATLEQKLQRWEKEYEFRSVDHHVHLKNELFVMLDRVGRYPTVVDSGAHVGDTGLPFLQRAYGAHRMDVRVVFVEPDRSKCLWIRRKLLELNATSCPGIYDMASIVNAGLWSHETHASLIRDLNHAGAWTVEVDDYTKRAARGTDKVVPRGEIHLLSIGDILEDNINFAIWHLDVEQSETRALMGLSLTVHRPVVIFESFKQPGTDFLMPKQFLELSMGYKMTKRIPPNMDRVLWPPRLWDASFTELPSYE